MPATETTTPRPSWWRPVLLGALGGLWSAFAGLAVVAAVVLAAWFAGGMVEDQAGAVVLTAHAWLAAVGASVAVPGGRFSLLPLGLTLIQVALVYRATGKGVDVAGEPVQQGLGGPGPVHGGPVGPGPDGRGLRAPAALAATLVLVFAAVAGVVAALAAQPLVRVDPAEAVARAMLVGAVGAALGVLLAPERGPVIRASLAARAPNYLIRPLAAAAAPAMAAVLVLLGSAALVTSAWLLLHAPDVAEVVRALDPGLAGSLSLLILCLVLLPTMVVWAMAYVTGVGFAVGQGTAVSPSAADIGALPGIPVLAAIPDSPLSFGLALQAVPWVAGLAAGLLLRRRLAAVTAVPADLILDTSEQAAVSAAASSADGPKMVDLPSGAGNRALVAMLTGVLAGLTSAVLTQAAAGSIGPGRLAEAGSPAWQVGIAVGIPVALAATVTVVLPALITRRNGRPSEAEPVEDRVLQL